MSLRLSPSDSNQGVRTRLDFSSRRRRVRRIDSVTPLGRSGIPARASVRRIVPLAVSARLGATATILLHIVHIWRVAGSPYSKPDGFQRATSHEPRLVYRFCALACSLLWLLAVRQRGRDPLCRQARPERHEDGAAAFHSAPLFLYLKAILAEPNQ